MCDGSLFTVRLYCCTGLAFLSDALTGWKRSVEVLNPVMLSFILISFQRLTIKPQWIGYT